MVETLAPAGYAGRLRTTLVACATFAAGALAGGVITFGGLGAARRRARRGGRRRRGGRASIALAAAVGEARGARIVPQVRRQVPESWRRVLPVPLAAGLYGVLLGLGFTTFILTLRRVGAGRASASRSATRRSALAIGLGFGVGRALPVVVLAPAAATDWGAAAHAAMAERPAILRGAARRRRGRARRLRRGARRRRARARAQRPGAVAQPRAPTRPPTAASLAFQRPAATGDLRRRRGSTVGLPGPRTRRSATAASAWIATAQPHRASRRPAR